jgi:hypothetical protein
VRNDGFRVYVYDSGVAAMSNYGVWFSFDEDSGGHHAWVSDGKPYEDGLVEPIYLIDPPMPVYVDGLFVQLMPQKSKKGIRFNCPMKNAYVDDWHIEFYLREDGSVEFFQSQLVSFINHVRENLLELAVTESIDSFADSFDQFGAWCEESILGHLEDRHLLKAKAILGVRDAVKAA